MAAEETCRSCGAPILWRDHERTGKPAPIDAEPAAEGNVAVDEPTGTYRVLAGDRLAVARGLGSPLRTNHFMTCPQAPAWARR